MKTCKIPTVAPVTSHPLLSIFVLTDDLLRLYILVSCRALDGIVTSLLQLGGCHGLYRL